MKSRFIILFIIISVTIVGCAKAPEKSNLYTTESVKISNSDPLEPINRVVFSFNDIFDRLILRPIAIEIGRASCRERV